MSLVNFEVITKSFTPSQLLLALEQVIPSQTITSAIISTSSIGERKGALKLLRSVSDGMLLMWDRGLHSFKMVDAAIKQKSHFLESWLIGSKTKVYYFV